jgi:hypothetical protein
LWFIPSQSGKRVQLRFGLMLNCSSFPANQERAKKLGMNYINERRELMGLGFRV